MVKENRTRAQIAFEEAEACIDAWRAGELLNLAISGLAEIPASVAKISPTVIILTEMNDYDRIRASKGFVAQIVSGIHCVNPV